MDSFWFIENMDRQHCCVDFFCFLSFFFCSFISYNLIACVSCCSSLLLCCVLQGTVCRYWGLMDCGTDVYTICVLSFVIFLLAKMYLDA
jgi:hypothetical protein